MVSDCIDGSAGSPELSAATLFELRAEVWVQQYAKYSGPDAADWKGFTAEKPEFFEHRYVTAAQAIFWPASTMVIMQATANVQTVP